MKKRILTTLLLVTMILPLLPSRHAEAANSYFYGYKINFIPNTNNIYLEGKFISDSTKKFHAHFCVTIGQELDCTHKICSGYVTYYVNSKIFSLYQPFKATGYTTK
ncbi:MAG: hypothetical protein NC293_06800 [Roseburia sp.]|nr:hypothetical protein [Roseburia sp.]